MSANDPGHQPASSGRGAAPDAPPSEATNGSLASASRRRALLKGLGKATAVAGAAIPLRSLATGEKNLRLPKNGKNYRCTVSAQASLLHSAAATLPPACSGKPLVHYCTHSNWPQVNNQPVCWVGAGSFPKTASLNTVMNAGSGTTRSAKSLAELLADYPTSDEAHWVVALLNAYKDAPSFPYSTSQVRDLYANTTKRADAIAFFRTYMEGQLAA